MYMMTQTKPWECTRCLQSRDAGSVARVYLGANYAQTLVECPEHPVCGVAQSEGAYCDVHGDGNLHPDCTSYPKEN